MKYCVSVFLSDGSIAFSVGKAEQVKLAAWKKWHGPCTQPWLKHGLCSYHSLYLACWAQGSTGLIVPTPKPGSELWSGLHLGDLLHMWTTLIRSLSMRFAAGITPRTHRQVLEGSLRRQSFERVQDARFAPVLVHEQNALGGALLPAADVIYLFILRCGPPRMWPKRVFPAAKTSGLVKQAARGVPCSARHLPPIRGTGVAQSLQ